MCSPLPKPQVTQKKPVLVYFRFSLHNHTPKGVSVSAQGITYSMELLLFSDFYRWLWHGWNFSGRACQMTWRDQVLNDVGKLDRIMR